MQFFSQGRGSRPGSWRPTRRPSLAARVLETPAIWAERLLAALGDLFGFAPASRGQEARLRAAASERATRARAAAAGFADELDRLSERAADLSASAARRLRPRRRGVLARLLRAPTPGERLAEGAQRARRAGAGWIDDLAAPLASLWGSTAGRAKDAGASTARRARDAADFARYSPREGVLSWLLPRRRTRLDQAKAQAQAARRQAAEKLDAMRDGFDDIRRSALALGDHEAARDARNALARLSRLRLRVIEEPAPSAASGWSALATALGAQRTNAARSRSRLNLADFTSRAGPSAGYAAAALGAVAAYALIQSLLPAGKASGFGAPSADGSGLTAAARAAQPGRGRAAASPAEIPLAGWKDILWRTWTEIGKDRLVAIAAGVVFYGLLALFPAIAALVSSYGLFASPAAIGEHLGFLQSVLPPGAFGIVQDQIQRVVSAGETKLGLSFVFGLALALWSANAGVKAIIDALNIVYDEEEKRGFFKLNAVSLAFTVGAVLAALIGVAAIVVAPALIDATGILDGDRAAAMVSVLRWPVLIVLTLIGLATLYRYGPSRREAQWRWLSVGAVAATALWLIGSVALSYYIANFADYDKTYGSLGAAIGMMMWLWLSAIVVLFGAELNSEIERQTARDSTVGTPKPLGARGATTADTVGASYD